MGWLCLQQPHHTPAVCLWLANFTFLLHNVNVLAIYIVCLCWPAINAYLLKTRDEAIMAVSLSINHLSNSHNFTNYANKFRLISLKILPDISKQSLTNDHHMVAHFDHTTKAI